MIRRSQLVRWYQPTAESYVCLTSAAQTSDRRKNIASAHAHCAGYEGQKTLWLGLHGLLRDVRETFPRQVADVSEKSPTSRRRQQLVSRKTHTTPKLFRDKTGQPPRGGVNPCDVDISYRPVARKMLVGGSPPDTDAFTSLIQLMVAWHSGRTSVCARPAADWWPRTVRCRSANQADSAFHPFGVYKWVVGCN